MKIRLLFLIAALALVLTSCDHFLIPLDDDTLTDDDASDDDDVSDDDTLDDDDTSVDDDTVGDDDTGDDDSAGDDDTAPSTFCDAPTGVLVFEDGFEVDNGQFDYFTTEQEYADLFMGDPSVDFPLGSPLNIQQVNGPGGVAEGVLALINEVLVDPLHTYYSYRLYSENISADISAALAYGEAYIAAFWVRASDVMTLNIHHEEGMDLDHSTPPNVDDLSVTVSPANQWVCMSFSLAQANEDDVWEDDSGVLWPVPVNTLTFLNGDRDQSEQFEIAWIGIYRQ